MRRITSILLCMLVLGVYAYGQDIQITGTVTSADDGSALPGVAVLIKGTGTGTTTDADGKYTISAPSDAVLVFSFIGMKKTEASVDGRSLIPISLETETQTVDEVVITALGLQRETRSLGYSFTKISSEELTKSGSQSALNALKGKVAGIDITSASGAPGSSTRAFVRGFSSLSRTNQPLYVIDGVPVDNYAVVDGDLNGGLDFGNKINDLNPDDIASINVLKGSAASILYGSRAANGVIIITTKNGGSAQQFEVNYSGSMTWETPLMLPEFQNTFGQGFYGEPDLIENTSWGPKMDGESRLWGRVVDNSQQVKKFEAQPDNVKDFFDYGLTNKHTLSLSNGTDNTGYYISYGYVGSDGIFPTDADSYKRHTLSLRGNTKYKFITMSASLNYLKKNSRFVPTGQEQSVYDNIMQVPRDISIVDGEDYHNKFWDVDNYYSGYTLNPYYVLNEHGNKANEDRYYGKIDVDAELTKWAKLRWNLGGEVSNTQVDQWRAITYVGLNDPNNEAGRVIQDNYYTNQINSDLILILHKTLGSFDLNFQAGENTFNRTRKIYNTEVIGLDIPFFYHISNSAAQPTVNYTLFRYRLMGVYGNFDVGFKNMLFLSLSARNDWSSTLPPENNSYLYPGANMSFVFSELIPKNNVFSFGKLRIGFAQTGNDAAEYKIKSVYIPGEHFDGYRSLTYPLPGNINGFEVSNRIGNDKLHPEITREFETGTDLRFFTGRINIDFTYYYKVTTDLIWDADMSPSSGYMLQTMNLGKMTNQGIELLVSGRPVVTSNFKWDISVNFTRNKNKVNDLESLDQISIGGTNRLNFVARPGYPIGMYYAQVPQRDSLGRIIVSPDGIPLAASEYEIVGEAQNDWAGGLSNTFTYKNISLGFTIDTRQGGVMYARTAEMQYFAGTAPKTTYNGREPFIVSNSVVYDEVSGNYYENTTPITDANLHTYWGQDFGGGEFNKIFLVDRSFVKLREIVLSYSLPASLLEKAFIKRASFSLIGRNLLIWTPKSNTFIDPETTTFGDTSINDSELEYLYGEYSAQPTTRSFGFALNLTF